MPPGNRVFTASNFAYELERGKEARRESYTSRKVRVMQDPFDRENRSRLFQKGLIQGGCERIYMKPEQEACRQIPARESLGHTDYSKEQNFQTKKRSYKTFPCSIWGRLRVLGMISATVTMLPVRQVAVSVPQPMGTP
ncbi:hypothetical protein CLCR_01741 [Cladophialophora carrionii]|uniref:Uncharacterized protein n=1 Tax=Cladophialophora carrionii TaxID=86049 RepID=A0A1C1CAV7_9EURO|nr:hypothetical protein CLCR_01741 [Cladophialophora carrionii]